MSEQGQNMLDAGATVGLMSVPWWWSAVSGYGQMLLLLLGVVVAALRAAVLIRDLRRGK